ncbi:DNA primase [Leekyejoonella antrihumi]|uniref:DNA primase n=1 Tax=Leekyejoonella antrihumi TaxID=1660198 RepID=A0A563DUX7_9MICO|nr:DNA primase [Leekyejoonella antrihumi]TWP34067.1 DNA primase [Leekyejoonella antrihumi]
MPGLIKAEDIALVKERASLEDVVREHVTLKSAGSGSLKGLCPFHDEKTPSFQISPARGAYHCFGCGKGGDVISFVMEVEHLTFAETLERLAAKIGIELHYEEGSGPRKENLGRRTRLIEAHRVAEEFYAEELLAQGDARAGRDFLRARGFNGKSAAQFGVGFAPRGGEALAAHLRGKGFTAEELTLAGLVGQGRRGLYDRFRGRLVWPIRDITGDTVGFGARRIFDDDRIAAKYLNTSETPIYKKTHVLYGLDLAKKQIAQGRRAVVVEGYTDVMAAHLAGVGQAVATCGTAFGAEHVKLLRRLLRDDQSAQVVYTFDGDKAGQAAAMKAFELDEHWAAQSFVAVADDGQDPCELRLSGGDEAVRTLVDAAVPMFEFAARTTIDRFDLNAAEGRVQAMRAVAPMLATVRDPDRKPMYARMVAGWLGVGMEELGAAVSRAAHAKATERHTSREAPPEPPDEPTGPHIAVPDLRNPVVQAERQLLQCLVQFPTCVPDDQRALIAPGDFDAPMHSAIFEAIVAADPTQIRSAAGWTDAIAERVSPVVKPMVAELAVASLPTKLDPMSGRPDWRYVQSLVVTVRAEPLRREIDALLSEVRRTSDDPQRMRTVSQRLNETQKALSTLRATLE